MPKKPIQKGFTVGEVLMPIGMMGVLAITMLSLNNFSNNPARIASAKLAQTDAALKVWSKAVVASDEAGLGANESITSQQTLTDSLVNYFKSNNSEVSGEIKIATGDAATGGANITLNNGVTVSAKYLLPEDKASSSKDVYCTDSTACAVIQTSIPSIKSDENSIIKEEYALFADGLKSTDAIYEGWNKSPVTQITVNGTSMYYYCAQESCLNTGCTAENIAECTLAPKECQTEGYVCANVYSTDMSKTPCGANQTGFIETSQTGTVVSGSTTTTVDKCCDAPKVYERYDENNNKICVCPKADEMTLSSGYVYDENSTACQKPCPKGTYLAKEATSCSACAKGAYCPQEAMTTVNVCPKGSYCPATGAEDDENYCDISYRKDKDGNLLEGGLIEKVICPKGFYCPVDNITKVTICPKGTYCPDEGMTTPISCPAGTFSDATGALSSDTCKPCPKNMYSDTPGATACIACDLGNFTPALAEGAKVGASLCIGCPSGSYYDTTLGGCKLCAAGTYQNKSGQLKCEPCAGGYFNNKEGATQCNACLTGSYSPSLEEGAEVGAKKCTPVAQSGANKVVTTDIYGNETALIGQFKRLVEKITDGVVEMFEKVFKKIDVFFVSLFG